MSDVTVGFIGIGNMGGPMCKNILKGGHSLTIYDLDAAKVESFIANEPKARRANGPVGVAQSSNVIITMLPTGAHVRDVMTGIMNEKAFQPGAIVVDMSSSDPAGTRALAATLKQAGVTLIDAPVSGGVKGAEAGTLAMMIGSDSDAAVARAEPVLKSVGGKLFRTGGPGSGHAMKCINNFLAASNMRSAVEAMSIGLQFGLDPALMVNVFNASSGRNTATETHIPNQMLTGKFAMGFAIGLMAKDVGLAAGLANELGVYAPGAVSMYNMLTQARETFGYNADATNVYKLWTRDVKPPKAG